MSDLIDRQASIEALDRMRIEYLKKGRDVLIMWECEDVLRQLPSAQPERKKGKWLPVEMDGVCYYRCDQCKSPSHRNMLFDSKYNFCPNCGADMRGENNG